MVRFNNLLSTLILILNVIPFSVGQEFLKPTRLYVKDISHLIHKKAIKAVAHITGGGLPLNLNRVIGKDLRAEIDAETFDVPSIYGWISSVANVPNNDLLKTFNCGIGMVMVVDKDNSEWKSLETKGAKHIGFIKKRNANEDQVVVMNFDKQLENICDGLKIKRNFQKASITYVSSGVDIEAGDTAVQNIKDYARSTVIEGVLGNWPLLSLI